MDRILTLARSASFGESENVLKRMIAKGLDIIVYMKNFKVVEIQKIIDYSSEKNTYETKILWK